jgi:hypothetical protein
MDESTCKKVTENKYGKKREKGRREAVKFRYGFKP